MIVVRRTVPTKKGRVADVAALLVEARRGSATARGGHAFRIYVPVIGPYAVITFDMEFETLADYLKWGAEVARNPEFAEFMGRWQEVTERGGGEEIWELAE